MFDDLVTELDAFEQTVSSGKLPRRSILIAQLTQIKNIIIIKLNQGKLPIGSKSTLSKLSNLADALINGLKSPEIMTGNVFVTSVRDKFGPLNTALTKLNKGETLNADQKAHMRTFEGDADKTGAINALMEGWKFGPTKFDGATERDDEDMDNIVRHFLHNNFTADQLKTIDRAKWDQITYKEIYKSNEESIRKIKAELVQRSENDYKALSESYRSVSGRLPTKIPHGGAFSAIKFPVVTVWSEVAASKNEFIMQNAGFKVTRVGAHFSILENQYLLCIDLDKAGVGQSIVLTKEKARTRQVNAALWGTAQNIVNTINERSPVKYAIASNTVVRNPRNARIAMIWLITEKQRMALTKTLHSREVDWDIPRHNNEAPRLSHGTTPVATQKLIDASYDKHHKRDK